MLKHLRANTKSLLTKLKKLVPPAESPFRRGYVSPPTWRPWRDF